MWAKWKWNLLAHYPNGIGGTAAARRAPFFLIKHNLLKEILITFHSRTGDNL